MSTLDTEYRMNIIITCGYISAAIYSALDDPSIERIGRLKEILMLFCDENLSPQTEIKNFRPFEIFNEAHFTRIVDPFWDESMKDISDHVDIELQSSFSYYQSEPWLRWMVPSPLAILRTESVLKLAYTGMVIVEELLHIIQRTAPDNVRLLCIQSDCTLRIPWAQLPIQYRDTIARILESDITYFLDTYMSIEEYGHLQWFQDRINSPKSDIHHIMKPSEMVLEMLNILQRYGDTHDFALELISSIPDLAVRYPELIADIITNMEVLDALS